MIERTPANTAVILTRRNTAEFVLMVDRSRRAGTEPDLFDRVSTRR